MRKKRTLIIGAFVLLLFIVSGVGFYLYNKPRQSAESQTSTALLPAATLYKQYQDDEHVANQKYLGKTIEVQGLVSTISQGDTLEILSLSSNNAAGGINCQMFASGKNSSIKVGDAITIKGKCTGFLMDVNLVDCIVKQ